MRATVPVRHRWSVRSALLLGLAVVLSFTGASVTASKATAATAPASKPAFAIYYLWWTAQQTSAAERWYVAGGVVILIAVCMAYRTARV